MAQPQGKMEVVVSAELKGRQTVERLEEVVCEALFKCEHVIPISDSVSVRETAHSRVRHWYWRRKRRIRAWLNTWSREERRRIAVDMVIRLLALAAGYLLGELFK